MKFQDRKTQYSGRVRLIGEDGSDFGSFYICLDEGAASGNGYCEGTPLNASSFEQFKADILNAAKELASSNVALGALTIKSSDGYVLGRYDGTATTIVVPRATQTIVQTVTVTDSAKNDIY